ncbi:MSC_0882 family membrane protein [Ureaplasma ceti]|uniref:Uncharacterized protein n=1 Tax=Ureaplasma ceti TaxID=3119530 RepID=A0ABP9UAF4_9BACT
MLDNTVDTEEELEYDSPSETQAMLASEEGAEMNNPYEIMAQTIKATFDKDEMEKKYQMSEYKQRQKLANAIEQTQHDKPNKLPGFFKSELVILQTKIVLTTFLIFACIALAITFYMIQREQAATWFHTTYYAPIGIVGIPCVFLWCFYIVRISIFSREVHRAKQTFDANKVSIIVQKLYKRLILSFININWFAAYIYLTGAFVILLVFLIDYFVGIWYLGGHLAPQFGTLNWEELAKSAQVPARYGNMNFLTVVIVCSIAGVTLVYQVFAQIFNYLRVNKIELSYNVPILAMEEIRLLKKDTNKRNLIIFCVLAIVFALVLLAIYLILRKKK